MLFTEKEVLPGAKIYATPLNAILFGCPIEILKFILIQKQSLPSTLVIPDTTIKNNTSQASIEFLIYHFLFIQKGLARNIKMKIYCPSMYIEKIINLLRVTLLGPTKEEIINLKSLLNLQEEIDLIEMKQIAKECEYFAIKTKEGRILQIEDIVQFISFDIGETRTIEEGEQKSNFITISHFSKNNYEINFKDKSYKCDLSFDDIQKPIYNITQKPIQEEEKTLSSDYFSLRVLGSSEGFDPTNSANGYLFYANGKWILWDCPGYTSVQLKLLNLEMEYIDAIFISHVHEDHLDIAEIICRTKKLSIYTTAEIFHCILIKAMAIANCSYEEAKEIFDFHIIHPQKQFDLFGLKVEIFHSVHSIPAIGVKMINIKKNGTKSTFWLSGDHASHSKIEELEENGAISKERSDFLVKNFHHPECNVNFIDAGKGIVHGDEADFIDCKLKSNSRIYFMHTRNIMTVLPQNMNLLKQGDYIVIE